jgi:hypothetical protein
MGEPWFHGLRSEAMFAVLRLFGFRPLGGSPWLGMKW